MADSEDLETKSLLLILFGFMGSKPRYMQKYHKIVDGMQNITIHTVYPMKNSHSIFKTQRLNTLAKETLEYTAQFIEKEIKANHTPFVVFYVFSNAGGILMATINDVLCDHPPYKHMFETSKIFINGIIFESCPGLLHPSLNINHMNAAVHVLFPKNTTYPRVIRYLLFSINYCMMFIWYCIYRLGLFRNDLCTNYCNKLLCARNKQILAIPSLFLYSDSDKSIPVEHITQFIQMRRQSAKQLLQENKPHIQTHNFRNSAHVQHYLKHATEYKMIILSFLYSVMKREIQVRK
eukprot:228817_1